MTILPMMIIGNLKRINIAMIEEKRTLIKVCLLAAIRFDERKTFYPRAGFIRI
jgi:hypothetical protein